MSKDFTIGVEEEYQLVDPATLDLRSCACSVIEGDWSGDIRKELQESTIEIGTPVAGSSREVRSELARLRTQASVAAQAEDLRIVAAGLHPFADWHSHVLTAGERYARMGQTYGRIARDEHNYGMHVHVAVSDDRIRLLNRVRRYVPHLVCLACSSPFHEGSDTGYASFRMVLWRRWPGAGVPPRLEDEREYRRFVDAQLRAGVLGDERNLYWMIRPHPAYPTLEFRMCDVCPTLDDAVAIAGLARTIVYAAAQGMLTDGRAGEWSDAALDAALSDDTWRASRYGLDAQLIETTTIGGHESARDAIRRLGDVLAPAAADIGETCALDAVARICERGNAADRMRALQGEERDLRALVGWLARETLVGTGMDRRGGQRPEEQAAWRVA